MQQKQTIPIALGISIGDIYYVLFRRKWMLIGFALAGILAAVGFYFTRSPVYQSEAKLFIRYLQENKSVSAYGSDSKIKSLNEAGDSIINTELEILTSLDVAEDVAEKIGPEKILGKGPDGKNPYSAAALIRKNMMVEAPRRSSVIRVVFRHSDPKIVQAVLNQIIDSYFEKHLEIHRKAGLNDEFLRSQTDQLKNEVTRTEEKLAKIKHDVGITSLEDAKKSFADHLSKINQDLYVSEAQLVERQAIVNEFSKLLPIATQTNAPAGESIPPEAVREYKDILARLDKASKEKQELEIRFKPENVLVKEAAAQVAQAEKLKQKLEDENPQLTRVDVTAAKPGERWPDLYLETVRLTALTAKINQLKAQLTAVQEEAAKVEKVEGEITLLQRKRDVDEAQYRYYLTSLDASRVQDSLGAGKVSNISKIQAPSPALIEGVSTAKILAGIVIGGIVFGFALAFLTEFYLDRTVRRPMELEKRLNIPLLLSIPDQGRNGTARKLKKEKKKLLAAKAAGDGEPPANGNGHPLPPGGAEIAPWDDRHSLRPFYEGLRDRLVTYFEVRNLTHKPKLIALAGCAKGSGVSTIAAGLAASLSETGDGNVLLVDMNQGNGAAQDFRQGKPICDLSELLENGNRDHAQVQDNLYVVREGGNGDKLPRILPKRFSHLVPKLKASDYDYIIFDMPPVSQISVTPRLAGFMDMVMLVIESEKTDREAVQRAYSMLVESKANVTAVLNKTHSYVPHRLHQEMPGEAT